MSSKHHLCCHVNTKHKFIIMRGLSTWNLFMPLLVNLSSHRQLLMTWNMNWQICTKITCGQGRVFSAPLATIQTSVQWALEALWAGWTGANHSPPSSTEVKNAWSYTYIPPTCLNSVVLIYAQLKNDLTFTFKQNLLRNTNYYVEHTTCRGAQIPRACLPEWPILYGGTRYLWALRMECTLCHLSVPRILR